MSDTQKLEQLRAALKSCHPTGVWWWAKLSQQWALRVPGVALPAPQSRTIMGGHWVTGLHWIGPGGAFNIDIHSVRTTKGRLPHRSWCIDANAPFPYTKIRKALQDRVALLADKIQEPVSATAKEMATKEVTIYHCVGCKRITIEADSDCCACGQEFYPVARSVPFGKALTFDELKGDH